MTALDDELGSLEERLDRLHESGRLRTIEERLHEHVDDWEERARRLREARRTLGPFLTLAPSEHRAYQHMARVYNTAEQRESALEEEIASFLDERDQRGPQVRQARRAADVLGRDDLVERADSLPEGRFSEDGYRERYDEEYHDLRERFDDIDTSDPNNLDELQDIASQTQELVHKYDRVGDQVGARKASELHTSVEDAASRVAPIYERWEKKRITIAALIIAGAFGFWKGDIAQDYVDKYLLGEQQAATERVVEEPPSDPKVPASAEKLPSFVTEYATGLPARYLIALDRSTGDGGLYDAVTKSELVDFDFTANHDRPEGQFYLETARTGAGRIGQGSVSLRSDAATLTGTYGEERLDALEDEEMGYWEDIYIEDTKMVDIYRHVQGDVEETLVVIGE